MTSTAAPDPPGFPDLAHLAPPLQHLPEPPPGPLDADWVTHCFGLLHDRCDAAGDVAESWVELVRAASELEGVVISYLARVRIEFRQATDDEDAAAELRRCNNVVVPAFDGGRAELSRRLLACPHRPAIDAAFGPRYLELEAADARVLDPAAASLRSELGNVLMRHAEIFGQGTITWRGERRPFSFAAAAARDQDRTERHAAWSSAGDYVRGHEPELQGVYDRALALRRRIAATLGLDDAVELRYLELGRTEYGPREVAGFRQAVLEHVVPVAREIHERQAARLGCTRLHPADQALDPSPPVELRVPVAEQLDRADELFGRLGEPFAEVWEVLRRECLVDLPARPGKGTGASCSTLPREQVPFLLCNSVGVPSDVTTLVHEFGHAMQAWHSRHIEPVSLRSPTLDACEIHSMTLELLAAPQLGGWVDAEDLDRFAGAHLRRTVTGVSYMAAVDAFQHEVYDDDLDAEGRGLAWRRLSEQFQPGLDHEAEPWWGRSRWLMQLHVFQYPFYYIDYALAQVVAWQLWLSSIDEPEQALERYLALCAAGGTKGFRALVTDAGLDDPFVPGTVERTMVRLGEHLAG